MAEDVSGLPGLAHKVGEGGLGFDYRFQMGVADYWVSLLKETRDEHWDVGEMLRRLTDRRLDEGVIVYAESHD